MKLIASLIVRNELERYLKPCIQHLEEFCDAIAIVDDASTDNTHGWLYNREAVHCCKTGAPHFFEHEGNARQFLLEWTLSFNPTHVLAIDADEFVTNGREVRDTLEANPDVPVFMLKMEEVWKIDTENLWIRNDGGWNAHQIPCLWRVPPHTDGLRISDRALACGREPEEVRSQFRKGITTGQSILHFGWTNEAAREARYQRYVTHDGGAFHASAHIQSIMFPDSRVRLQGRPWPESLISFQDELLSRAAAATPSS